MAKEKSEWEKLEIIVTEIQKQLAPDAEVRHNHHITGKSGSRRKIDVSIKQKIGIYPLFIVFDCKRHSKPVTRKDVAGFAEQKEDVSATLGVMVSNSGFDAGAKFVAKEKNIILQTYREANEVDWNNLLGKDSWLSLIKTEFINIRAKAKFTNFDSPIEVPANVILFDKQSNPLKNLYEIFQDLANQFENPDLGEFSIQIAFENDPVFVEIENKLFEIEESIVTAEQIAKQFLINLNLAEGKVLEDSYSGKTVYTEVASQGFDWAETINSQEGVLLGKEDYENFINSKNTLTFNSTNTKRYLRLVVNKK